MNFIKVSAHQCNSQGSVIQQIPRSEIYINKDLIGGFTGNSVLLKGGHIIYLGERYYRDLMLPDGVDVQSL